MRCELQEVSDIELINLYSKIIRELKKRGVVRTKNIIGDLGEHLAIFHHNNTPGLPKLQATPPGTQNVDALSRKGDRYSVKATSGRLTSVFYGLNDSNSKEPETQKFEYVVLVLFNEDFELHQIVEITWLQFLKFKRWHKTLRGWNISVTKDLLAESKTVFKKS